MYFFDKINSNAKDILIKIKTRDFLGHEKIAIKNSIYQFLTTLVGKIFSLIITVVTARVLLPELFGLYSLALSTILIFVAFSDLGIGETLVRFVSKELGKGNIKKAEAYSAYLIKIKIFLMICIFFIMIFSSKFISETYYHKPVFLALVAGSFYAFFSGIAIILQSVLQAHNLFKQIFYRELLFQVIRVVAIPLVIILALRGLFDKGFILFLIIAALALISLLSSVFLYVLSKKEIFKLGIKKAFLSKIEKKRVNRFVFINSTTTLSGIFFGYIDVVMLGYFVSSEYIGYYQTAFSFIGTLIPLMTFSMALLPVFSRLNKKDMGHFLKKTIKLSWVISVISFLFLLIASKYLVLIIFGSEYYPAINILRIFSLLLLSLPVITIYPTYFTSIGKPEVVSKSLIISTLMNVTLNFLFISYFLRYNQLYAVYGAALATLLSRYYFMFSLIMSKRKISA